ncbi:hypothetical protein COCON_G00235190, partial [Conger conger]
TKLVFIFHLSWTEIKLIRSISLRTGICFKRKENQDMWHFWMWMVYLLLLFCGLSYCCGSKEYLIHGECCLRCSPGTHVYKHCTQYNSTWCLPCAQKSFIDLPSSLPECLPCNACHPDLGLRTVRECTPTSDTVCGPLDQHYCTETHKKGCRFAQRHTICRPGQFIKRNGTTLTNTECGECPDRTFSENYFSAFCKPHTDCQSLVLQEITAGTNTSDSECGPRNYPHSRVAGFVPAVLVVLLLTVILGKIMKSEHNRQREQQNEERRMKNMVCVKLFT